MYLALHLKSVINAPSLQSRPAHILGTLGYVVLVTFSEVNKLREVLLKLEQVVPPAALRCDTQGRLHLIQL